MTTRRTWLLGASTAALAAGAGVGVGWHRTWLAPADANASLWSLRFERPEGGELVLASLRRRIVVINFWATWCPPCVKELPEFDRLHRERGGQGVAVVGLAVDGPTPVRQFLQKLPVGFDIGLAGFEGTELARQLGNTGGGLPFTVLFDRSGQVRQRKLGQTDFAELSRWLDELGA